MKIFNKLGLLPILAAALALLPALAPAQNAAPSAPDADETIKPDTAVPEYVTTREMAEETKAAAQCLQYLHILKKPLQQVNSDDIIRDYAGKLDNLHLFFTAPEIKLYQERFAPMLDFYYGKGSILPGFAVYKDFLERVNKRVDWINKRLDRPFDLNTDKKFVRDRSKVEWPKDEAEADKLWEERLTLDLIIELLGDSDKPAATRKNELPKAPAPGSANTKIAPETPTPERIAEAVANIRKRYNKVAGYLRFEPYEVEEIYLNTLAAQYDPHSAFFSKQSLEEFDIAMRNSLKGVGALLQDEDGYCTIKEILPGGPIEDSKRIKVGDRIVAIGQGETGELIDIVGMRLNKIVNRLRGPENTIVRLRIEPAADHTARYTIALTRKEIKLTTKLAQAAVYEIPLAGTDQTAAIGVIDLPAFYGKTGDESGDAYSTSDNVAELLEKLKKHNIRGLVLDLRRNGGGLLDEAVKLAGFFIPTGPVLQVRDSMGKSQHLDDTDQRVLWDGPLIVLVSKLSASASEIVAGALQDHKRAIIVGDDHTHGKGSVQTIIPFSRIDRNLALKSAIKITVQKWYLPGGNSIQVKGVASDIVVPSVYSVLPIGEVDLEKPLPWDNISSVLPEKQPDNWTTLIKAPLSPELLAKLRDAGEKRQAEMPEFLTLNRTIAWTKTREKSREYPLNYDALRTERIDDKAFRENIRAAYKELESTKFKEEIIKLDAAVEQEKKEAALKAEQKAEAEKTGSADDKKTGDDDAGKTDEDGEEEWPDIDVQLRESLRILGDWVKELPAA